ncbi:hypothetical protein AGOR_G00137340 [Albula goreensis]|uniref:Cadherin domain-containing protein n=1 Tax=Albula goreensis TaxID=1534307 RepID=A0A8T3D5E2_9TELE|nr:hypothetical protein AGOR_G00137340 [Albula goreensis]
MTCLGSTFICINSTTAATSRALLCSLTAWNTSAEMASLCTMKSVSVILLVTLNLVMFGASYSGEHKRSKRAWIIDSFSIEEENPGPFPYELGKIEVEREYRVGFSLHGKGVDEDPMGILTIDEDSGVISVHGKVDYEMHKVLKLVFEAKNMSNLMLDTKLGVEISITDVNDQVPEFQRKVYETSLDESAEQGTNVLLVLATDADQKNTVNSTFDYRIVSVTPTTPDVEFYILQSGQISFKGCLDYEKANKYAILVEAKDRGDVVQLSSTCTVIINIIDKNNHLPTFIGHTGHGNVKERETGKEIYRIHVDDRDKENTPAWRAKYTIHGDKDKHFKVVTDPETNDGIITVEKPLDFEEGVERNLSISLENEELYFSCKVKRKTKTGSWEVDRIEGKGGADVPPYLTRIFSIVVEDINDPPSFKHAIKDAMVMEDVPVGHSLEQFTAVDLDIHHANIFQYVKGNDPAGWLTVDSKTGWIKTAKLMDRESPYVVNNTYTITLFAVDNGEPPMTATATLNIYLKDVNDNKPQVDIQTLGMCQADGDTLASITASDLDEEPYSGPFRFELVGNHKGRWHLDPTYGTTVNLVKSNKVYSGEHVLTLKVYDTQEVSAEYNLTVTVCDCSVKDNCQSRSTTSTQLDVSAVWILIASLLFLLGILLLASVASCKKEKYVYQIENDSEVYLIKSNIERPGSDCKVPSPIQPVDVTTSHVTSAKNEVQEQVQLVQQDTLHSSLERSSSLRPIHQLSHANSTYRGTQYSSLQFSSSFKPAYELCRSGSMYRGSTVNRTFSTSRSDAFRVRNEGLNSLLGQRLYSIQDPSVELYDYQPHVYAYEEDFIKNPCLDAISIPESNFSPELLLDLGPRFIELANMCKPSPTPL